MTVRNNEERLNTPEVEPPVSAAAPQQQQVAQPKQEESNGLQFVTPTEFVELPSRGKYYPDTHPLYNKEVIEIRYMTAKDEDILSSQTLLRKGIAVERLLQNIVLDQSIRVNTLLIGDKNAILLAARCSGYGADYKTQVDCPKCGTTNTHTFDLNELSSTNMTEGRRELSVTETANGTFITILPKSGVNAEFRLLTGEDEVKLTKTAQRRRKNDLPDTAITEQLKIAIVSVNNETDKRIIEQFVDNMPAFDSRYFRALYADIMPTIDLIQSFVCNECGSDEEVEVPFTADFFWPG
jgi:hypothetical protein